MCAQTYGMVLVKSFAVQTSGRTVLRWTNVDAYLQPNTWPQAGLHLELRRDCTLSQFKNILKVLSCYRIAKVLNIIHNMVWGYTKLLQSDGEDVARNKPSPKDKWRLSKKSVCLNQYIILANDE